MTSGYGNWFYVVLLLALKASNEQFYIVSITTKDDSMVVSSSSVLRSSLSSPLLISSGIRRLHRYITSFISRFYIVWERTSGGPLKKKFILWLCMCLCYVIDCMEVN